MTSQLILVNLPNFFYNQNLVKLPIFSNYKIVLKLLDYLNYRNWTDQILFRIRKGFILLLFIIFQVYNCKFNATAIES